MQVNSVNNNGFKSRSNTGFNGSHHGAALPQNLDEIVMMDDRSIRRLAYQKTVNSVDDKKHKNLTKAMFLSIPVVAGIADALINPAKSKFLSKNISGVSARLLNGVKGGAMWGTLLGLGFGINSAVDKLEDKSETFRKFTSSNPLMTFGGMALAFAGSLALGCKYIPKAVSGIGRHIKPETIANLENKVLKKADKFNKLAPVKSFAEFAKSIKDTKALEPLKGVVKTALDWAPTVLLWGGALHAFNHNNVKNQELVKNYSEMKEIQSKLAKAKIWELTAENHILAQKAAEADNTIANVEAVVDTAIENA